MWYDNTQQYVVWYHGREDHVTPEMREAGRLEPPATAAAIIIIIIICLRTRPNISGLPGHGGAHTGWLAVTFD